MFSGHKHNFYKMSTFLPRAEVQNFRSAVEQLLERATAYMLACLFAATVSFAIKDGILYICLTKFSMLQTYQKYKANDGRGLAPKVSIELPRHGKNLIDTHINTTLAMASTFLARIHPDD